MKGSQLCLLRSAVVHANFEFGAGGSATTQDPEAARNGLELIVRVVSALLGRNLCPRVPRSSLAVVADIGEFHVSSQPRGVGEATQKVFDGAEGFL